MNHDHFKLLDSDSNVKREKLISHLSAILCSIDLKFANIYFEFESKGRFLDGVFTETSRCVPLAIILIG